MKMNNRYTHLFFLLAILFFSSCKKDTQVIQQPVIDGYIYDVDSEPLYQSSAEKNKQKTTIQYVSILYSNLFQQSIPQDDLTDLSLIRRSKGDKQLIDELIINSLINDENVIVPSDQQMRDDIPAFVDAVYLRFFLREPTAYEKYELIQEIEDDPDLTPKLIYTAFAISNEYKFY